MNIINTYVGCIINNEKYLIPALDISHIIDKSKVKLTIVNGHQPEHIEGIFMSFENVITVINTSVLLEFENTEKRLIYVLGNNKGLLVDNAGEVMIINEDEFQTSPTKSKFINKVYNSDGDLYFLLDVTNLT